MHVLYVDAQHKGFVTLRCASRRGTSAETDRKRPAGASRTSAEREAGYLARSLSGRRRRTEAVQPPAGRIF
jgi:hypothetical protein